MRCAITFDENKPLYNQKVKAWGEMQSLKEDPAYKEEYIKSDKNKNFFDGYKYAFDDMRNTLNFLVDEQEITKEQSEEIQTHLSGSLCEMLFSILDNEENTDDPYDDDLK